MFISIGIYSKWNHVRSSENRRSQSGKCKVQHDSELMWISTMNVKSCELGPWMEIGVGLRRNPQPSTSVKWNYLGPKIWALKDKFFQLVLIFVYGNFVESSTKDNFGNHFHSNFWFLKFRAVLTGSLSTLSSCWIACFAVRGLLQHTCLSTLQRHPHCLLGLLASPFRVHYSLSLLTYSSATTLFMTTQH